MKKSKPKTIEQLLDSHTKEDTRCFDRLQEQLTIIGEHFSGVRKDMNIILDNQEKRITREEDSTKIIMEKLSKIEAFINPLERQKERRVEERKELWSWGQWIVGVGAVITAISGIFWFAISIIKKSL